MSKNRDHDLEDENPLYIRISKKKYAQLLNIETELGRIRRAMKRYLRPHKSKK